MGTSQFDGKRGFRPPPPEFDKPNWLALVRLLEYFDGIRAKCARECGVSRQTVHRWIKLGRVSAIGALRIHYNPGLPFTKEQLRPDIQKHEWSWFNGTYERDWMSATRMKREGITHG